MLRSYSPSPGRGRKPEAIQHGGTGIVPVISETGETPVPPNQLRATKWCHNDLLAGNSDRNFGIVVRPFSLSVMNRS
jgi:hypothetical protein